MKSERATRAALPAPPGAAPPARGSGGGWPDFIECLGSGKLACRDGVVTRSLPGGGYQVGTQCTQTILRCKNGCAASPDASVDAPEALCVGSMISTPDSGGACPTGPYPDEPVNPLPPSSFGRGTFGCHSERTLAPVDWTTAKTPPACEGTNDRCIYEPSALPCGVCSAEGSSCSATVYAPCDCGQGAFLDTYWDGWVCRCTGGAWDCRVTSASGSSCFRCAFKDATTP